MSFIRRAKAVFAERTSGLGPGVLPLAALVILACCSEGGILGLRSARRISVGVHMDLTWRPDDVYRKVMIQRALEVHSAVSRNSLLWHLVEPVKGQQDWSLTDSTVDDLVAHGIAPLMVVVGSPSWANGASEVVDAYYYLEVPTDSVAFAGWVTDYRDFIRAAARRYRGRVRLWELGNEENGAEFWRPRPNVAQYATWYSEMRDAIKAENPDATVSAGGLTLLAVPSESIGTNINGVTFVQQLYAADVFPDAIAVHPYTSAGAGPDVHIDGARNFDDIEAVREVMVRNGQGALPMWVTEWGWSTSDVTPTVQAGYLQRSLELLSTRYAPYVTVATYFALGDYPGLPYGLYDASGNRRPAADVFAAFMRP